MPNLELKRDLHTQDPLIRYQAVSIRKMATTSPAPQTATSTLSHDQRPGRRWHKSRRNDPPVPLAQEGQASLAENLLYESSTSTARSANSSSLALRPASVAPEPSIKPASAEASAADAVIAPHGKAEGTKKRGRGRGGGELSDGRRGKAGVPRATNGEYSGETRDQIFPSPHVNGQNLRFNPGRQFGRTLTRSAQTDGISVPTSALQGDAAEFHPGRPHIVRPHNPRRPRIPVDSHQARGKAPHRRRDSILKSTAPDIGARTHEDILNGVYECPICTSEIVRDSKIWSCKTCWTVFHLSCITKWSSNEGSNLAQHPNAEGELPPRRQWRCPGCNLPKDTLPSTYDCWCEKEADPRSISGLPPHSCGQTCGKPRIAPKKCPHPCELICHAGPCPPCSHLGSNQSCFCGKGAISRRCIDTNYDAGWSCGEICEDIMPCGEHTCPRPCHEGLCGACEVRIDCRCYCGKIEQQLLCSERGDEKLSSQATLDDSGLKTAEEWTGTFSCHNICKRSFDCGKHSCERQCHSQDLDSPRCPWSPDVVSRCPCGRAMLADLSEQKRDSCKDPIPSCKKKCLKKLACSHTCQQVCHSGECMPCLAVASIGCRCGRVQSPTVCHQGKEEPPQCMRACKATLSCGRHECGERCCSGERKAAERQAAKRKLRPLGGSRVISEGFEAEHICTRLCGRELKCGNHTCPEICHRGSCGSCREAIFDEISCHCGKTVLQPPSACGTTPPLCRFNCERPKRCGHPLIPHNCHGDEEKCPKCPFLGEKPCMCGKKNLRNQPCWLTDVRCGETCGRKLRCGSHFCGKLCHRPGECEDAGRRCQQACGKSKKNCGHPCEEPCHAPTPCREDKPCQNKMLVTCNCQHLKQEHKCNAYKANEGNSKKKLSCDDECARLERNRKLALALNIDPDAHKDDHVPYSSETLRIYRENTKWSQLQEKEFRIFAADENEKRLRFRPMQPYQRAFIHSLSEDFGLDSESMDPEPYRHVAVFKTPRFVMAPMKTLAECVRIHMNMEASGTNILDAQRKTHTNNLPYNGFLLTHPRFGITLEEIRADFSSILDTASGVCFDTTFLPSEEIVIKARASSPSDSPATSFEATIKALKPPLEAVISSRRVANSVQLCSLDSSMNVVRREVDDDDSNSGWSRVAAKAAAPRSVPRQMAVGEKSVYTVLGSKLKDAKKKKEQLQKAKESEAVADDWEEEAMKEEAVEERIRYLNVNDVGQAPHDTTHENAETEASGNVDAEE